MRMSPPHSSFVDEFVARPLRELASKTKNWWQASPRARRMGKALGVLFLVWLGLFLILDYLVMPKWTRHGQEFALPDVVGKPIVNAGATLTGLHLRLEVTSQEYNPAVPEGTTLSQYPLAGTMVKEDRIVKVVISLGKRDVRVPKLAGVSVRQAQLDLETTGLTLGEISWTHSDTLPEMMVVFSFPRAGEKVSMGSKVNIMVNKGRAEGVVYMPNLVGLPLEDASSQLTRLGLALGKVKRVRNQNFLPETVLEQSAPPAAELFTGDEINLVVSKTD